MDYAAIAAEIAKPEYAGLDDGSIAERLNTLTVGGTTISWLQTIDSGPLDHGDILAARGERWEDYSIPNYPVASAVWAGGVVTVKTVDPHPFPVGTNLSLTYSAFIPNRYDGTVTSYVIDNRTLTYPMPVPPPNIGPILGTAAIASAPGAPVGSVTDGVRR